MGEKGNAEVGVVAAAAATGGSVIERTTVRATETVVGTGQDLADAIRERSIGAVADETVEAARERLQRRGDDAGGDEAGDVTRPTA